MEKQDNRWCIACGEREGQCNHNSGTINNINAAYRIWLKRNRSERLNDVDKED